MIKQKSWEKLCVLHDLL